MKDEEELWTDAGGTNEFVDELQQLENETIAGISENLGRELSSEQGEEKSKLFDAMAARAEGGEGEGGACGVGFWDGEEAHAPKQLRCGEKYTLKKHEELPSPQMISEKRNKERPAAMVYTVLGVLHRTGRSIV